MRALEAWLRQAKPLTRGTKAMRATASLVRRLPDIATRQSLRTLMYRGHDDRERAREGLDLHWRPYAQQGGAESLIRQVIEACAAACRVCGDECEKHAQHHEHCRICAQACRCCEQACREATKVVG